MNGEQPSEKTAPLGIAPGLPQTLGECHLLIAQQALLVNQLQEQVGLLEERIKLDSKNSSKPPSSDGPARGSRMQRKASERKRGAQPGHKGNNRALLEQTQVDQIIDCKPVDICQCGAAVAALADEPVRHQVFDVPPIKAQVHEYRRYAGRCTGCGKAHRGALPAGVPRGQIGPRALALVGTLGTHYQLTQLKIRDLLARMMGVDFSVGAISQAHGKVAQALAAPVAQAGEYVRQAPLKHLDETRYPRESAGNWVWVVVTPQVVQYSVLPSRARYVAHDLLGKQPVGIVISDRYAVYDYVDATQRQLCWAHLLRDFNRIGQRKGEAGRIGRGLLGAGYLLFRWREQGKSAAQFEPLQRRIKRLLSQGYTQAQCTRTAKTCANLLKLWRALWTFLQDKGIAPTNNEAERALRALVLKRKISGPTRSRRGDEFLARGFSAYESCRRQGRDLWDFMHQAVVAWVDASEPPSLIPVVAPTG